MGNWLTCITCNTMLSTPLPPWVHSWSEWTQCLLVVIWLTCVTCNSMPSAAGAAVARISPWAWRKCCTYCRCLRKHLKCHFFQIDLNNWFFHMLHESIKVSLIAISVEQLIYLFLTRCCLVPILPKTLQRHPCPLGRQNHFNTDGCGWGSRVRMYGKKQGPASISLRIMGLTVRPTCPCLTKVISASWCPEGSSPCTPRSSRAGVKLCVHVPRTGCQCR